MADRLRWWCIPAGLVVLVGTVAVPAAPADAPVATVPREAIALAEHAILQDAALRRTAPMALDSLQASALVVWLPAACRGLRGAMTLWRRTEHGRESKPCFTFTAGGREDGSVPVAGLAAGRYDVKFTVTVDGRPLEFVAADVAAPGEASLAGASPR